MRFSPKDFRVPTTQRDILLNGTREDLIQWLLWNDRNGVWSDEDSTAEGWQPISLEQARACMWNALGDDVCSTAHALNGDQCRSAGEKHGTSVRHNSDCQAE